MRSALLLVSICLAFTGCGHPSDDKMMANFWRHHDVFEKLDAMYLADAAGTAVPPPKPRRESDAFSIVPSTPEPDYDKRRNEYLEVEGGVTMSSSFGMFGRGSTKYYDWIINKDDNGSYVFIDGDLHAYVEKRTREWRESHPTMKVPPKDPFTVVRHIEGRWYLAYEMDQ